MLIQVLVDNPGSWMVPYARALAREIGGLGHESSFLMDPAQIQEGDILILLSCEQCLARQVLRKNRHNLVVHESDLPRGKGWSPLTHQILEGGGSIPITLFEAVEELDSGAIYAQSIMDFEGHELIDELREVQARETRTLILDFLEAYPNVTAVEQRGEETKYGRRRPEDSRLDPDKSLASQFDLLRVVDHERYPAFFELRGHRYLLKIEKAH